MSDTLATRGIDAITLFTEDLPATKAFYQDVFGLALVFEDEDSASFRMDNTIINLLMIEEAPELIAPGTVAPRESGARVQFTIPVDDVDAMSAVLRDKGVTLLNGPMNRPWGIRTAAFTDPAGHIWEIAGPIPQE